MKRFFPNTRAGASIVTILISFICSAAALAQSFPTTGGVIDVNVIRRYSYDGDFLPSISGFVGGGATFGLNPISNAIDGGESLAQWDTVSTGTGSSGGIDITLDRSYDLAKFDLSDYQGGPAMGGYTIEVSNTGFSSMTPEVTSATGPGTGLVTDTLASPVLAKYIRYTWNSPAPSGYVQLTEFRAYASTADASFVNPNEGYDIVAMGAGAVTVTNLTPGKWIDNVNNVADVNESTYLRGNGAGDAQFELDLGSDYLLQAISLGFFVGQDWADATIEFSLDGTSWNDLINVSPAGPSTSIAVPGIHARYLRVTDVGGDTGALSDIQVFAVPEPASAAALGVGCLLMMRRRSGRRA